MENKLIPIYSEEDIKKLTNNTVIGHCKIEAIANFNICNQLISERNREIMNTLNKPFTCML